MLTYDCYRNAITTGSRVMVFNKGLTGVIKTIHGEDKTAEQIRRSECVEIEGCEGAFCPMELVRLELH
ncbi:putative selenium delivery protein YdfZ [Buttiauxella gaviniae]|uniref:putative selenium delivery protein YdfZ n=1 Tax=Buttiauxella gaviniae TaxID=82990 RepID=UPI003975D3DA